jgi:iron complex transport system substrate-binding protein
MGMNSKSMIMAIWYERLRLTHRIWMQAACAGLTVVMLHGALSAARARPQRVVSTNVCTDQLLLLLAEPSRIVALSNLAGDPALSVMAEKARGFRKTGARAEEIVPLKPDLLLANAWTGAKANRFLSGLGIKVLIVPEAKSFVEIADVVQMLGQELDVPARAAEIIAAMNTRLKAAARPSHGGKALIYEPNGYSPSKGTLSDAVLTAAGWSNLAPELGIENYGSVPLERVVMTRPDLMIFDDHAPSNASRAQGLLQHPALKKVAETAQTDWMPARLWICAGPWTVEAVERLAKLERRP